MKWSCIPSKYFLIKANIFLQTYILYGECIYILFTFHWKYRVMEQGFECAALEQRGVKRMKHQEVELSVKFAGKLRNLANVDKQDIRENIAELVERHQRVLRAGALKLHLKQHKERFRQLPLFLCRAKFWTRGKSIIARGQEYGIWQTVDNALDKIEHKMIQSKERGLRFG